MTAVVRCTGCGGLARVGPEAVGLLVVCPRCGDPFMADPVPMSTAPEPPYPEPPPPPPKPVRAEPVAPPRPRRPRRRPDPAEVHDHPPPTAGGVPFSVIIGLALFPLTIPMLWLIGPILVGTPPSLTLATPVSLAVSAAVLCLAVAYTVDWSPATRIKGVLILVGLAYFAGLSLYFLKKDTAEWLQRWFGGEARWQEFRPPQQGYRVTVPGEPRSGGNEPVPGVATKDKYETQLRRFGRSMYFRIGSGADPDPDADPDEWFTEIETRFKKDVKGRVEGGGGVKAGAAVGRAWVVKSERGSTTRLFRVYRANGRLFTLSVEGGFLDPDDDDVLKFFDSFAVTAPDN